MNHHATNTNSCPNPFSYSSLSSSSSSSSSSSAVAAAESPYALILYALSLIPIWHYLLAYAVVSLTFLYNFLDFHFFQDFFSGFRGCSIGLTYHPSSPIYNDVVSHCKILHGRYLATPWLSNPHFQTCFLNFLGRPPAFRYRRQLFRTADGGTIALDWLMNCDVCRPVTHVNNVISKDDTTPIVVVVPGLTSDSAAAYMRHLVFHTAKQGWNVVVSNHRGLGGVSITSDCFYNAGWTEDIRVVIRHLHCEYPKAPLFAIGTSIGANVLVKYLGEDGEKTPVAGAAAICNPWDLLIGDRFICRRFMQKLYDKALAAGLQGYAQLHETLFSHLANWEGITKSRSIRDFDNHATCLVGKFETVDTYYRRSSSASHVGNVKVPLLCISALDDPVCTREAIPWDECRANKNIVLATPEHGGHLAFFEGLTAAGLWWVRAVNEYLRVLHSSPYMHEQKTESSGRCSAIESSIDQSPYVNVTDDGMVAAVGNEQARGEAVKDSQNLTKLRDDNTNEILLDAEQVENLKEPKSPGTAESSEQCTTMPDGECSDITVPISKCFDQISLFTKRSMWLLALIAVTTSWPLIGSVINVIFKNKPRSGAPAALLRR